MNKCGQEVTIYSLALIWFVQIGCYARFLLPLTNSKGHPYPGAMNSRIATTHLSLFLKGLLSLVLQLVVSNCYAAFHSLFWLVVKNTCAS